MRNLIALLLVASSATVSRAGDAPAPPIDQQIAEQRACIARSDATIRRERAIAKESGATDARALYVAGADKVHCRDRLAELLACKKKGPSCSADPYAPTLPQIAAPDAAP
jgi:hypothetical protein